MPATPKPANPCFEHSCSRCCYDTEMPLTEADTRRLESIGHRREDFSVVDEDGVRVLVNTPDHCVFLGADGHCGVYAHRPEGCRLYPLVWSQKERRVVRDDFCPYSKEFPIDPKAAAHLETVLATIEREAAVRKGKVYGASSSSSAGDRLGS